jgi:hypothetical protein
MDHAVSDKRRIYATQPRVLLLPGRGGRTGRKGRWLERDSPKSVFLQESQKKANVADGFKSASSKQAKV